MNELEKIIIDNLNTLLALCVAAFGLGVKKLADNPEKFSAFINGIFALPGKAVNFIFLLPFNRHSIKYRDPLTHPMFTQLLEYRDLKTKEIKYTGYKQQVWKTYIFTFYSIMLKSLEQLCKTEKLNKLSEPEFESLLSNSFIAAYSDFMELFAKRCEMPDFVMVKIQRFEKREVDSFKFVINVWKSDDRWRGNINGNSIQLYNVFNDLMSRFKDFYDRTEDFFEDLNGTLERMPVKKDTTEDLENTEN